MKKPIFTGVCTALVTPFHNGTVDTTMLERLLIRQLEAGVKAFVLCGTTGEAPTLSDEEKCLIFRIARDCVGRGAVILAGTGSNDTAHAVRLSRAAEDCGADGLLVVSPYYNKATPSGLLAHYRAVAEAVSLPVILYNVPTRTAVDLPVSVCRELAELPNIAGIKEASSDLQKVGELRSVCPESFSIWSGNDDLTLPVIALGGQGVISVASNVRPGEMVRMTDAALNGNFREANQVYRRLLPLMKQMFSEVNPIPVKAAMEMLGYDCGGCRLPLTPLSDPHRQELQRLLT